jgi:hypothetical protein
MLDFRLETAFVFLLQCLTSKMVWILQIQWEVNANTIKPVEDLQVSPNNEYCSYACSLRTPRSHYLPAKEEKQNRWSW